MANRSASNEWRSLRFQSIEDCIAEVQRILEADLRGTLRSTGNWSAGQVLAHVAAWIEYGYEGYPIGKPPFLIRWILRMSLKSTLRRGMSKGVRIPGVKGGTTGADHMPTVAAANRLLSALRRLQSGEEATFDSPGFGAMSMADRVQLNLRHAELHLGFLVY